MTGAAAVAAPIPVAICLWFDGDALAAAEFYATFPDSAVNAIHRAPGDYPDGHAGDVLTVGFSVLGLPCLGLNGGSGIGTARRSRFRSIPIRKAKPIVIGTRLSAMAVRKAPAAGARTAGVFRGRLPRAR